MIQIPSLRVAVSSALLVLALHLAYEDLRVVSLSLADQRAVIQLPEGEQRTVSVGDEVPEVGARVVQVLRDRLVLREGPATAGGGAPKSGGKARSVGKQIWIYRYSGSGRSRVQVLDRSVPPPTVGSPAPAKEPAKHAAPPRAAAPPPER